MSVHTDGSSGNYLLFSTAHGEGPPWDMNAAYTLTGWFKVDDISARRGIWTIDDGADHGDGTTLDFNSPFDKLLTLGMIAGTGTRAIGGTSLSTATWYFFAARRASISSLEGRLGVAPYSTTTTQGTVGADYTGRNAQTRLTILFGALEGGMFIGSMAQVRVWTASLSDGELITEMQATTAQRMTNIWADWRMVNLAGAGTDSSGQGNDLFNNGTLTTGADDPPNGGGGGGGYMWLA